MMLNEVSQLESEADRISSSVGLITVAMLLATVMSSRIDERKLENQIVALEVVMGKETEIDRDVISMPILIVALVLAALGIYLMLF